MIHSMTGYGKATLEQPEKKITIEIKSLNSKQFDWNSKISYQYKEKEIDIKAIVSKKLERGKIDFYIGIENTDKTECFSFDENQIKKYFTQLHTISKDLNDTNSDILSLVMQMPDVLRTEKEKLTEAEWKDIEKTVNTAVELLDEFRLAEGKILEKDFRKRISTILKLLESIEPLEVQRNNNTKARLQKNLIDFFNKGTIDNNRFEQELLYYLEKLDITEEKLRLKKHCEYFIQTLKENSPGKKLGFVCQEIGREINTLGAKANEFNIQIIVVQMKDELEKVKEQLLNIL